MMIVRIKGKTDAKTLKNVREGIKEQVGEGLIVHDDLMEITLVDEKNGKVHYTCERCGTTYHYSCEINKTTCSHCGNSTFDITRGSQKKVDE